MITHEPTTRTEQRVITVDLPDALDSKAYHSLLDAGWSHSETRIKGEKVYYVFTRPGRPKAGDVEQRITRGSIENRAT